MALEDSSGAVEAGERLWVLCEVVSSRPPPELSKQTQMGMCRDPGPVTWLWVRLHDIATSKIPGVFALPGEVLGSSSHQLVTCFPAGKRVVARSSS